MSQTNGQLALIKLEKEFIPLVQNMLTRVDSLGKEIAQLGRSFIGFELKIDADSKSQLRIYWYAHKKEPRATFGFSQVLQDSNNVYMMGEIVADTVSWWQPQASSTKEVFSLIEEAFDNNQLNLDQWQKFINEIQRKVPTIYDLVANNLTKDKTKG